MMRKVYFKSEFYNLIIRHKKDQTIIKMELTGNIVSTNQLPSTIKILNEILPSIFSCRCFNNADLPFSTEAKNTEIGHLFEHILLEYLCRFKIACGFKNAKYKGETSWDWNKYKRGVFDIDVSVCDNETEIFYKALEKSIVLINLILQSDKLSNPKRHLDIYTLSNSYYKDWFSRLDIKTGSH